MTRLSINEMTTYRWSFAEDVARYREHGITAIGVWRRKLRDFGDERGIDLLADQGMTVSNLMWAGGFTGSDGRSCAEAIDDAEEAIALAAAMQAGCLVTFTGGRNGHTNRHARRLVREALSEIEPIAADFDVTLALEPMHPSCADEWSIVSKFDEMIALMDELGSSHIRLALDTYHMDRDRQSLDLLANHVDRIAVVHLSDGRMPPDSEQNRCRLGEGTVPLGDIVQMLTTQGYTGDFDVKLMGPEIELTDYDELLAHSRNMFESLASASTGASTGASAGV